MQENDDEKGDEAEPHLSPILENIEGFMNKGSDGLKDLLIKRGIDRLARLNTYKL